MRDKERKSEALTGLETSERAILLSFLELSERDSETDKVGAIAASLALKANLGGRLN